MKLTLRILPWDRLRPPETKPSTLPDSLTLTEYLRPINQELQLPTFLMHKRPRPSRRHSVQDETWLFSTEVLKVNHKLFWRSKEASVIWFWLLQDPLSSSIGEARALWRATASLMADNSESESDLPEVKRDKAEVKRNLAQVKCCLSWGQTVFKLRYNVFKLS